MAATVRKRVIAEGRVQGVWYRQSTMAQAEALGVAGTVRNLGDGRVEAVFEGPSWAVDAAIEWCREGPPRATVANLIVSEEPPEGLLEFRITG